MIGMGRRHFGQRQYDTRVSAPAQHPIFVTDIVVARPLALLGTENYCAITMAVENVACKARLQWCALPARLKIGEHNSSSMFRNVIVIFIFNYFIYEFVYCVHNDDDDGTASINYIIK